MHLHARWAAAGIICAALLWAIDGDSSSTAPNPADNATWKNGELAPPLPDDPAARAAALDQVAKRAAQWTAPPGTRSVTHTKTAASVALQAIPASPRHTLAPVAGGPGTDRWLQDLQSRLRPPEASSKNETHVPLEAGEVDRSMTSQGPELAPSLITSFDGIDDTGLRPTAPDIAVGPNHILLATTDRLAVMDKCGNTLFTYTLRDFGGFPATRAYYTPRVIYDEWNNRWIMVFIGTETNYSASALYAFFTTGPDPTGSWSFYELVNPNFPGLKDLPGVSATPDGVYITWDRFSLSTFVFETAVLTEFAQSDFYDGGSTSFSFWTGIMNPNNGTLAFSIRPAQMHTYGGNTYFVDTDFAGDDFLTLWRVAGPPGSSVLTAFDIAIGAYVPPSDIAQPDGTLLDSGDCRVLDAVYSSGHLYETHGQQLAGSPVVTVIYVDTWDLAFYKYSTTPLLDYAHGYGAIDVDANDQVALVYSAWGDVLEPTLYYRFLAFPPGSNLGSGTLVFGQDSFDSGSQPNRWGPYMGCARDPIDGRTMWIYGMYASESPLNSWATRVGAVTTFAPSQLEVTPIDPYYYYIHYTGGFVGGPFSRDVFSYELQNTGQTAANWILTGVPFWLTAVENAGHLGPGETQTVTLHLNSSAYTLPEGAYSASLDFENCTGSGSQPHFIGLGIGQDGSCPGAEVQLYPKNAAPTSYGSASGPGMYITAIEDVNVCAVEVTAALVAIPQAVWARVYEANGVTRGSLVAEAWHQLVMPGDVKHSIPLAVALEACKDYEVSVEFTDEHAHGALDESSLYLPNDVGGLIRLRNASQYGNPATTEVAQIQLVTAEGSCDATSIADLGGSKGVGALASPDAGMFVQARRTVRLCSVAMNFGAAPGTKVTARVYGLEDGARSYPPIAEGSAVVSLPYLNYVDVPISAQLIGGSVYDVAVQVQGMAFYEANTSGTTPYLIDGVFNVTDGELAGVGGEAVPTLRLGWTEDQGGVHLSLGKPNGPYPPPLSLGSPLSQGVFVTSLINQEVYGIGVYADVPAGNFILAAIYHATGTTRGSAMAVRSVMSDASGLRWHDVPIEASLSAGTDYDIAVSATITSAPAWLDTPGLPYDEAGVIRIRDGEKDGLASNDKLIYMRLNACNDTATPVAGGPTRTPMYLAPPVPNPASGPVRLGYTVERPGRVEIAVYDVAGRVVATVLTAENARAGASEASFDATRMASGVYFVRLTTPSGMVARKLVVAH